MHISGLVENYGTTQLHSIAVTAFVIVDVLSECFAILPPYSLFTKMS